MDTHLKLAREIFANYATFSPETRDALDAFLAGAIAECVSEAHWEGDLNLMQAEVVRIGKLAQSDISEG